MTKIKSLFNGASGDSFFLISVRMVTLVFGLLMTRVLSEHFSLHEYGTYSQVILLTSTVSSMTILGMMDGINFFFCREKDDNKRNAYVSTIFFLHYVVGIIVSIGLLCCTVPIANYFGNKALEPLMIFAALLPILQNSISLLQVMFIAIGKAKAIAVRNLLVSIGKLLAIAVACYILDSVVALLVCQVLLEVAQAVYFFVALKNRNHKINILGFDKTLIKEILIYCIPMAMFVIIKTLNRDTGKFVISYFTNTETLAVYTNASKILPFDIVMTSFVTVLLPYVTRYIAEKRYDKTQRLYKSFLELSQVSTTILAVGAICVAPEMMRFLYTEKYSSIAFGASVFIIYTLVDVFSVLNITLILSAAGKTKTILFASIGTFVLNLVLNILFFLGFGEVGPAWATLIVTIIQGVVILELGARELKTNIFKMYDLKYMLLFIFEVVGLFAVARLLRGFMLRHHVYYLGVLFVVYIFFAGLLLLLNARRLIKNLKDINDCKMEK